MDGFAFEWDEAKAQSNLTKHRVPFESATQAFLDPAKVDFDASQSGQGEMRRKVVGMMGNRLVTVVYTLREGSIRIISARRANRNESNRYDDR